MSSTAPRPPTTAARPRPVAYARVSLLLAVLDAVVVAMVVGDAHGGARFVLGLLFALTVPGWAVVGLVRLGQPLLEASLSVATSLGVLMVAAQLAITVGWWRLGGLQVLVGLLSLPSLVWQALERAPVTGGPR